LRQAVNEKSLLIDSLIAEPERLIQLIAKSNTEHNLKTVRFTLYPSHLRFSSSHIL
jgi:hypothetical protein